jgi:hypothetical protein
MLILKMRRIGLTIPKIRELAKQIRDRDELTREELAARIATEFAREFKSTEAARLDWDSILEFIMTVLPLILMFI